MALGALFSDYFLNEGVTALDAWHAINDASVEAFKAEVSGLLADFDRRARPDEATTERDLIEPILRLLGWAF